jgi:hypothetical protein
VVASEVENFANRTSNAAVTPSRSTLIAARSIAHAYDY